MNCPECKKVFKKEHGNQRYCSKECRHKLNFAKYYVKNKSKIISNAIKYKSEVLEGINLDFWRNYVIPAVKKRDGEKCVKCGSKKFLEVHHKVINVENPTINDLVTLCKSCHRREHTVKLRRGKR